MNEAIVPPPPPPPQKGRTKVRHMRGCTFGCLYALIAWLACGFFTVLAAPFVFRLFLPSVHPDYEQLGAAMSIAILFFIAIPTGIYAYFIHSRREPKGRQP